jgi:hypothetical protein
MTAEEVLMIRGYASTAEEAQLMVRGTNSLTVDDKPQLYMALDVEDDEKAGEATTDLADAALQLTGSVALSASFIHQNETAVLSVINQSTQFFVHGVKPKAALDEIDLLLMRKMSLLEQV